ncbi:MAG: leucine-rich repeat domain-containing protein, partial [Bacteroides sp.]
GMEHAVYLPDATDTVPAGAFSHSAQLTSVSVGENSLVYSSENGILYTKDKTTLVAVPAGYGDAVVIPESVASIAPQSFAGSAFKSIVSLGAMVSIDPTAFTDLTKVEATVVLPSSSIYESQKAVWVQAGFTHFQKPAKPGDVATPDDSQEVSGFTYELLDDYTLSVSWQGIVDPNSDLVLPASASLAGVSYRVSTIAQNAFKNCTSLKSVVIPSSVTTVEDSAFKGCTQLSAVSLSEGITALNDSAFENNVLQKVILPKSLTTVGKYAFANNKTLTSVVALSTVNSVDSLALDGCSGVSIFTPYQESNLYPWSLGIAALGNHIEPYGITLFHETLALEVGQSANLVDNGLVLAPDGFEVAFGYPAACLSVAPDGFISAKAEGLSDVSISLLYNGQVIKSDSREVLISDVQPEKMADTSYSQRHLPSKLPLTSVSLLLQDGGISLMAVNDTFTSSDGRLQFTILEEGATVETRRVSVRGADYSITGDLNIPETVTNTETGITYRVTEIAKNAFNYCRYLSGSLTIPPTVTKIGEYAFFTRSGFTGSLVIPSSVTQIDPHAFGKCSGFTSI